MVRIDAGHALGDVNGILIPGRLADEQQLRVLECGIGEGVCLIGRDGSAQAAVGAIEQGGIGG